MPEEPQTSKQYFEDLPDLSPSLLPDRDSVIAVDSTILRQFILQGIITPPQITSDVNDYEPYGFSGASVLRLDTDAERSVTGLKASTSGRIVIIVNVGSNTLLLKDEDSNSSAENRFSIAATGIGQFSLETDDIAVVQYDRTSQRWRFLGNPYREYSIARGLATAADQYLLSTSSGNWTVASAPQKVYKASDETVNDSTTLQNDDDLVIALAANEVWAFQCYFVYSSGTTPDIKVGFTAPSGATGYWTRLANTVANTDFSTPATESLPASGGSDARFFVGVIINSSTAGNLQLQWAQDTQDASDTDVKAGSWMVAHRLA